MDIALHRKIAEIVVDICTIVQAAAHFGAFSFTLILVIDEFFNNS